MKIFFLILIGISMGFGFALADELNFNNDRPSPLPPTPTPVQWTLADKIAEGMVLLKNSPQPLGYEPVALLKRGKWVLTGNLLRKQIALALLNTDNGAVFEKRVWVTKDAIDRYRKKPVVLTPAELDEPLNIQPRQWNSFNTFYEVLGRPEMVIVATRYLVESKLLGTLPEKSKGKYTEIYYAPYSSALHQPELVEAGKRYIAETVDAAFADLQNRGISPGVSHEFVKTIMVVEHVDPEGFNAAVDGGRLLSERVLAIIGANRQSAYRYTGSPAGANGLAQFIRPTYNTIVRTYPTAGLIKDYYLGMADHSNAAKAMVLFFDAYRKEITEKAVDKNLIQQLGITEEMLAATYNGGPNRVARSLNKFGTDWLTAQIGLPKKQRTLAGETLSYLKKFLAVRDLGILK